MLLAIEDYAGVTQLHGFSEYAGVMQ